MREMQEKDVLKGSGRLLAYKVLQILKDTDEYHPVTQIEIADRLGVDRKTVDRAIKDIENELELFVEKKRGHGLFLPKPEDEFELYEVRLLVDSLIASHAISKMDTEAIIEKLNAHLTPHERKMMPNLRAFNEHVKVPHQQTLNNVYMISAAIQKRKQIHFTYYKYGKDLKLHPVKEYQISPYQLVYGAGFYMVLGQVHGEEDVHTFRLDKMKGTTELDVPMTMSRLYQHPELEASVYVEGHPYMQSGRIEGIDIDIQEDAIDRLIDVFGSNVRVMNMGDFLRVHIKANTQDVYLWALQNADVATVYQPQNLRNRLRMGAVHMREQYLQTEEDHADWKYERWHEGRSKLVSLKTSDAPYLRLIQEKKLYSEIRSLKIDTYTAEIAAMLPRFTQLRYLCIQTGQLTDLTVLQPYPLLREIRFDCPAKIDLSPLRTCKRLQLASFRKGITQENLAIVAQLNQLDGLSILDESIEDLSFIRKMPQLSSIGITCMNVRDYTPLYALQHLNFAHIDLPAGISFDATPLAKDPYQVVRVTRVTGCDQIEVADKRLYGMKLTKEDSPIEPSIR